jgi:hypothetical protein
VSRSHESNRELLAIYALDALEGDEIVELESHVADCDTCRDELDEHRAVASLIGAQSVEVDVPQSLWHRVRTGISPAEPTPLRPRRLTLLAASGIAAAMLVLVFVQTARLSTAQTELVAMEERLEQVETAIASGDWSGAAQIAASMPAARSVALTGEAETEITLLPNGTGFVTHSDLADLPSDRTYQLWIVQRGEVVSAGLLRDGEVGSAFRYDPSTLEGLVVTAEEAAGVVVSVGPAVAAWFDA